MGMNTLEERKITLDIKELSGLLKDSGIIGAGGAGFPTYAKLDKRANTIILNCAECEPLLKVHRQLLMINAYEIMSALNQVAEVLEVQKVFIALKDAYHATIAALQAHKESFPRIEIKTLKEVYPMGDEVVLIYETIGKVVPPGSIPIEIGVTVFNVETMYNIYLALHNKETITSKYLTIAGEVQNPITVKVPIGASVQEVVELAGGVICNYPSYVMGGPMTGNVVSAHSVITKTTNAILVFPENHYVIRKKQSNIAIDMKKAMSVCCQCECCTDMCPRHELGQPIEPHKFMRSATSGVTKDLEPLLNTMFCCGCGVCEMFACPQELSPRRLITEYKNGLRKNGVGIPKGVELRNVSELRNYRLLPMERLIARLNIKKYDVPAPYSEIDFPVKQVKIMLNQHIGASSKPIVEKGAIVKKGEMIATSCEGALSVPTHASIEGKVVEVNDNFIILKVEV